MLVFSSRGGRERHDASILLRTSSPLWKANLDPLSFLDLSLSLAQRKKEKRQKERRFLSPFYLPSSFSPLSSPISSTLVGGDQANCDKASRQPFPSSFFRLARESFRVVNHHFPPLFSWGHRRRDAAMIASFPFPASPPSLPLTTGKKQATLSFSPAPFFFFFPPSSLRGVPDQSLSLLFSFSSHTIGAYETCWISFLFSPAFGTPPSSPLAR